MKYIIPLLIVLIFTGCSSVYVETKYNSRYYKADLYARAFKVKQLRSTQENELRVWWDEYIFGDIFATLVTEKGIKQCKALTEQTDDREYRIHSAKCNGPTFQISESEMKEMLSSFLKFNDKKIYCTNVMDGAGGIIEGVYNGERFAFSMLNPDSCELPEAKEVTRFLGKIEE